MAHKDKNHSSTTQETLLVGWDSEYDTSDGYFPISNQLYILKDKNEIFIENVGRKLSFKELIGSLRDEYPEYKSFTLVTHFSIAELQGVSDAREKLFEGRFRIIGKNITGDFNLQIDGQDIHVQLIDTNLIFPKSLDAIGELLGLPKLDSDGHREAGNMLNWFREEPEQFKRYALRDAEITVKFYDRFRKICTKYGLKESMTIGGIYEKAIFKEIINGDYGSLGYQKARKNVQGKYQGYKLDIPRDKQGFKDAYYGGRNETYLHGMFEDVLVSDYDLVSAYSTILSLVPAWDVNNVQVFTDADEFYEFMKMYPLAVGYVDITFKFGDGVIFPSLCIKYEDGLYFVKEGETICTPQEFLISYPHLSECKVIAKVYHPAKKESVVSIFTRELKIAREEAKAQSNSLEAEILKLILNSGYGKFAQGINENKKSLNLKDSTPERLVSTPMPHSKIFSPLIASFVTGCVRALIGEYLHYLSSGGIDVGSVTTDGFTILGNKLMASDLNGVGFFSKYIKSRTGGELLELKHDGTGFIGIKTRGYAILEGEKLLVSLTGVSLRSLSASEKIAFIIKEFKELSPFKNTKYTLSRPPSVREWLRGREGNLTEQRSYNWDYDLKRKPVIPDTSCNSPLRFRTTPFETLEELTHWRECYVDFKRGLRKSGKQTATKNKLISGDLLNQFENYIDLRKISIESIKRVNSDTNLRIFANLLKRLKGWGYKRMATALDLSPDKTKYWIKKTPLSDEELKRGVNSELISTIGSLITPPEFRQEILELYEAWISEGKNENVINLHEFDITNELMSFLGNQNEIICSLKNPPDLDILIHQNLMRKAEYKMNQDLFEKVA